MHKIGDTVIYGTSGVCVIEDLREEQFAGTPRTYYILRPLAETGKTRIYVPADNEALVDGMHPLLPPAVLLQTIADTPAFPPEEWPEDGRLRNKRCKELLASGSRELLLRLIKTVRNGIHTATAAEESACLRAGAMLYQEFSLVLELEPTDTIPLILGEISAKAKENK